MGEEGPNGSGAVPGMSTGGVQVRIHVWEGRCLLLGMARAWTIKACRCTIHSDWDGTAGKDSFLSFHCSGVWSNHTCTPTYTQRRGGRSLLACSMFDGPGFRMGRVQWDGGGKVMVRDRRMGDSG